MSIEEQDKKIIEDCIQGRQNAWEKFVQHFSGLIIWSIKSRLTKFGFTFIDDDVKDIHQEVFVSIYSNNKLGRLKDISKAASWISIIAGNIAINYIKRKGCVANKSISLFDEIAQAEDCALTVENTLKAKNPLPGEEMDAGLIEETLAKIIERLNPREKLILNLYYIYDNTINEIAQELKLPQGSVASIMTRIKDKFRQDFQQKGLL